MRIAVFGMVMALMAQPAAAECFTGRPQQLTYDKGRVITIIQRHGDDLTYTQPYEGFQDTVNKTRLMLFPLTARAGARSTEYRWTSKLPKLKQMVPGYHFDVKGTMKSGEGKALPYRVAGDVLGQDVVTIGDCPYAVMVVKTTVDLDNQPINSSTEYLSPDLGVTLRSEFVPISAGKQIIQTVVAIQ